MRHRITLDNEAWRALELEAMISEQSLQKTAGRLILQGISPETLQALKSLPGDLEKSKGTKGQRDKSPGPKGKVSMRGRKMKPRLDKEPMLSKVKEIWNGGEHNKDKIAKLLDYPKSTAHAAINRLIQNGVLQE